MKFNGISPLRRALLACAVVLMASPALAQVAPQVKFATTAGDILVEVYPDKAPKTVENFLQYVKDKHYDGTIFHRVIPGFMIQGGGFDSKMAQKPTRAPVIHEGREALAKGGARNVVGTLAMARTPDPNSASAQFFINIQDNASPLHLVKTGPGKVVLAGNNLISGSVTIAGGTLQAGDNSSLGGDPLGGTSAPIANNGILALNAGPGPELVIFNVVNGSGSIRQIGDGDSALTEVNTYTGRTSVVTGVLSAQNPQALGSLVGLTAVSGGARYTSIIALARLIL